MRAHALNTSCSQRKPVPSPSAQFADALDFINSLLTYDPDKRLSASSALAHRWLAPPTTPFPADRSSRWPPWRGIGWWQRRRSSFGGGGMAGGAARGMAGSGGRGRLSGGELGLEMSGGDGHLGGSRGLKRPYADSLASAASGESNGEGRHGSSSGLVVPPMAVAAAAHTDLSGVARIPSPDDVITTTARQC